MTDCSVCRNGCSIIDGCACAPCDPKPGFHAGIGGVAVTTGLSLDDGLLSFNGREIGEVYECEDSTRDDPIYRCQLYGGVNSRRGFTTKEAAGQELMNDAVAWLWQLHSDLNPHSLIAALQYILPLAKAYVAANPVGSNQDFIDYATHELEHALSVLDEKPCAKAPLAADEEDLPW